MARCTWDIGSNVRFIFGQLLQEPLRDNALLQILCGIKIPNALPDNKDQFPPVGHCHAVLESTKVLLVH
ncbi:hypothetical protein ALQ61_200057 [Pseudomonas coronafaciens pv. zizaniae]|nr:hypothetical protein ALQ61_200057 [Pseudomonas coronafaciens pv. zizaniae]